MNATVSNRIVSRTYDDCVDVVKNTVWKFMKIHNINSAEFDELFSQANIHFMEAYREYDKTRVPSFIVWMQCKIWCGLLSESRKISISRDRQQNFYRRLPQVLFGWQIVDIIDELSADARNLLMIFRDNPKDLEGILCSTSPPHKRLFRYLIQKHKWNRQQIYKSFRDICKIFE